MTDVIPTAKAQPPDPAEVVRVLLAEEAAGRDRANLHTRRKRVGLPTGWTFGDRHQSKSSMPRATQDALKGLGMERPPGESLHLRALREGKRDFTEALGQTVIETGLTVAWFTIEDLGMPVRRHRADAFVARSLATIVRSDLIVVDDVGLLPVSEGRYLAAFGDNYMAVDKYRSASSQRSSRRTAERDRDSVRLPVAVRPSIASQGRARLGAVRPRHPVAAGRHEEVAVATDQLG